MRGPSRGEGRQGGPPPGCAAAGRGAVGGGLPSLARAHGAPRARAAAAWLADPGHRRRPTG